MDSTNSLTYREMKKQLTIYLIAAVFTAVLSSCAKAPRYEALIVTGQSESHRVSSESVKQIIGETGLFRSEILFFGSDTREMADPVSEFSKYDLVILDYEGSELSESAGTALIEYVNNGGGLVLYNSKSDPGVVASDSVTVSERHDFEIRTNIADHPVTNGLPVRWLHAADVIIQGLEIAGEDVRVLAAAWSDTSFAGSGEREPVLVARELGKGRMFATMIGSPDGNENTALHCAGFIVTLQRGAEWAASGAVTQEVPFDFPTAAGPVLRPDFTEITYDEVFENLGNYDISKSTKYFTCLQSMVRKAAGDEEKLLKLEKDIVKVLENDEAEVESKKLLIRELSWMGSEYCLPSIEALSSVQELAVDVDFALARLR